MALIVEDGTGLSNANSYISLTDAETYWTDHGSPSEWDAATDAEKNASLLYATRWLDDNFDWQSYIYSYTQSLGWPRWDYFDSQGRQISSGSVPQRIQDATCEIALYHLKDNINDVSNEGIASEKLGDASITYRSVGAQKAFSYVKTILREYGFAGKLSNSRLLRN